ncbi:MAG TPA: PaaX family transcriptional regulator C-terminal domain-containing protein [Acidimicrobiales bacterium]|nr:PaaX family transcriptional regulator C-terminal domain-containing protein [Acidimicrobiales bacterium]
MLASALLGETPPTLPVRRLVRVAAMFGINENRARVALSRMVASAEVVTDGAGTYSLSGRLAARSARLSSSRTGATGPYDGSWHVVVVTVAGDVPALRRERRGALRAARLAELRDGTWLRPANLALDLDDATASAVARFAAFPEDDPAVLAARVFDLGGWASRARRLCVELDAVELDGTDALARGFERDAEVLRHLQRDPLIPPELLPPDWPGMALRARFDVFDARYRDLLRAAHRASTAPVLVR